MFSGMFARIRLAASSAMGSVLGRLAVGVLLIIAAAFAVAALTLALIDHFGSQIAYLILAIGFASLGGLVAVLLSAKEDEAAAEEQARAVSASASASNSFINAETALAVATTLAPMLMRPSNLTSVFGSARFLIRNLPLLILALAVLILVFPFDRVPPLRADTSPQPSPGE